MADARLADAGRAHAIATPHAAATAAGDTVFRTGGNAFDAAVAAAVALTVVYPHMCAVGGDIIALAATADGAVRVVNGSGAAPAALTAADVAARHGRMPERGADTVTVPGAVAAWTTLLELGGTRRLGRPDRAGGADGGAGRAGGAEPRGGDRSRRSGTVGWRRTRAWRPCSGPAAGRSRTATRSSSPRWRGRCGRSRPTAPPRCTRARSGAAIVARLRALGSAITTDDLAAHATELGRPLDRDVRRRGGADGAAQLAGPVAARGPRAPRHGSATSTCSAPTPTCWPSCSGW